MGTAACPAVPAPGHAPYPPGQPKPRDRPIAPAAGRCRRAAPARRRVRGRLLVDDGPFFSRRMTVCKLTDFRQAHRRTRRGRCAQTGRGPLMAQRRHGGFGQKPPCRRPTANWQPKELRSGKRDQLPGPLETCGAVPQTALIPLATNRYSFGPPNLAVHSQKDKQLDRIHRSACLEPTGLKGLF